MWNHDTVWGAIDALAARHGLSPSGLARRAGLDPTAFNRSKRRSADGRLRWPSTESIAKVLKATGESLDAFVALVRRQDMIQGLARGTRFEQARPVPLVGLAQAGGGGFFDDGGFPVGQGWDEVTLPGVSDDAYALEVTGDSMLPLYRHGDILIVSPSAQVRKGDRVVVKTADGEVMAKVLTARRADRVELSSLNPDHADRVLPAAEIAWMARIVWASQ
jgi:phage repressor protein C with HTH and peptisase S24 domain